MIDRAMRLWAAQPKPPLNPKPAHPGMSMAEFALTIDKQNPKLPELNGHHGEPHILACNAEWQRILAALDGWMLSREVAEKIDRSTQPTARRLASMSKRGIVESAVRQTDNGRLNIWRKVQ